MPSAAQPRLPEAPRHKSVSVPPVLGVGSDVDVVVAVDVVVVLDVAGDNCVDVEVVSPQPLRANIAIKTKVIAINR